MPPGIKIARIVLRLKSRIHWSAEPRLHSSIRRQTVWVVFIRSWRSAENCDRCSDFERLEVCNRQLFGHPTETMRCRITEKIHDVHSLSTMIVCIVRQQYE